MDKKAQMDTLQTPGTKLNYAGVLWEQGQLDEAGIYASRLLVQIILIPT